MDQAAPIGANRRGFRRWRRWLLAIATLPLGALALSNLWLASPWGRGWLATKIQHRSGGLPTRVGGASWSPWNGVTLRDVVVSQPPAMDAATTDPLLQIDSLRLTPVWRTCMRGRWVVRDVELESPRVVLSVEMMSQLAQQASAPAAPLAAIEPAVPPIAALQPGGEAPPQAATAPSPVAPQPSGGPQASNTPPPPPAAPAPVVAPLPPTSWLRLRHASFRLVSGNSALPLLEIADLTSDLPVSGEAANSTLGLASLKTHGRVLLADFQAPLAWQSPVLSLKPATVTLDGMHFQFAGKLAFLSGLPLQLEVQMPRQSPAPFELPGGAVAKAGELATNGRFRGLLLAPATWQGDCSVDGAAISINAGEHHASFDNGSCFIALRGGVLSCLDARMVGDDLSLLGNATLFADGRAAGVLRLVAAPDAILGIVKRFFPKCQPAPALTPLNTPQRVACDIEVFGTLNALEAQLGHNGPLVPLP